MLCIPISFFIWSIVSQTSHYFYGIKKGQICMLLKGHADEWKLSYFEFSITSQIHRPTTVFDTCLMLLKLRKMGKNPNSRLKSLFQHVKRMLLQAKICVSVRDCKSFAYCSFSVLMKDRSSWKKKWYLRLYLTQIIHSNGKMLFAWRKIRVSKSLWRAAHV